MKYESLLKQIEVTEDCSGIIFAVEKDKYVYFPTANNDGCNLLTVNMFPLIGESILKNENLHVLALREMKTTKSIFEYDFGWNILYGLNKNDDKRALRYRIRIIADELYVKNNDYFSHKAKEIFKQLLYVAIMEELPFLDLIDFIFNEKEGIVYEFCQNCKQCYLKNIENELLEPLLIFNSSAMRVFIQKSVNSNNIEMLEKNIILGVSSKELRKYKAFLNIIIRQTLDYMYCRSERSDNTMMLLAIDEEVLNYSADMICAMKVSKSRNVNTILNYKDICYVPQWLIKEELMIPLNF